MHAVGVGLVKANKALRRLERDPFWCVCQKVSLSFFTVIKVLPHKNSEWSSLVPGPAAKSSSEVKNQTSFAVSYQQQSASVTHVPPLFWISSPFRSPLSIEFPLLYCRFLLVISFMHTSMCCQPQSPLHLSSPWYLYIYSLCLSFSLQIGLSAPVFFDKPSVFTVKHFSHQLLPSLSPLVHHCLLCLWMPLSFIWSWRWVGYFW